MTRINVVPPRELHDRHLLAEYRELPRVFALARAWHARGEVLGDLPRFYTLGKGHVTFFYNKLQWCFMRQCWLHQECRLRGFNVARKPSMTDTFWDAEAYLWGDWSVSNEALAINRQRIAERLASMRS